MRQKGTRVGEGGAVELHPGHVRKTRDFLTPVKIQGGFTSSTLKDRECACCGNRGLGGIGEHLKNSAETDGSQLLTGR